MSEEESEVRKPFLTSRQMGLAAAFGAAAFAFRALGLVIPMVPPLVLGPGALMPCLAGMAAGPIVGIIVGIARGIPSGLPQVDLILQPFKGIYWAFVFKYGILKIDDEKKRWPIFWIVTFLLQFFVEAPLFIFANSLLGFYPFYPTWPLTLGWYNVLYAIFQIIIFSAVIRALPDVFGWEEGRATW
ncbi:MAG: hypothetical protein GWN01_17705 [Nitrosopumilaceae archaeon]|nr:hypothetical protein [Nitrosopumilaceae archaeon]NIU89113.1 hypothetical protein [Nitrosopumilaceae archaeon]NIV67221.1 hypothetical protein [Nitrosopumilaceae archaeon]NIX63259.1 hypothetical protein [Nitrosopumilaceae archaeon]